MKRSRSTPSILIVPPATPFGQVQPVGEHLAGEYQGADAPRSPGSLGNLTHTVLGSVKKRRASSPPSRPSPLFLTPPKGVRRSRSNQQFTHTVPVSSFSATRCARLRSRVHS